MLLLSKSQSGKIADEINDEVVEGKNFKKLKNVKSKNSTSVWNLKATGELTFLTPGIREAFN